MSLLLLFYLFTGTIFITILFFYLVSYNWCSRVFYKTMVCPTLKKTSALLIPLASGAGIRIEARSVACSLQHDESFSEITREGNIQKRVISRCTNIVEPANIPKRAMEVMELNLPTNIAAAVVSEVAATESHREVSPASLSLRRLSHRSPQPWAMNSTSSVPTAEIMRAHSNTGIE